MSSNMQHFIRGVGSLFNIFPSHTLEQMIPRRTGAERMASHFARVGKSINNACDSFEKHESPNKNKTR